MTALSWPYSLTLAPDIAQRRDVEPRAGSLFKCPSTGATLPAEVPGQEEIMAKERFASAPPVARSDM